MKNFKLFRLAKASLSIGILCAALGFSGCLGGEAEVFQEEEFVVVKFDSPVSYSYKLKAGDSKSYNTESEDKIIIENKESDKTSQATHAYVRIANDAIKIYLGLDPEVKADGGNNPIFKADQVNNYASNALIHNKNKGDEGPLDLAEPISFTGKFTAIETHRKDFICKKAGAEVKADQKVPYKSCRGEGEEKEFTGQMVVTTYSKEDLIAKMEGNQFSSILQKEGTPLELRVKGMAAVKDTSTGGSTTTTPPTSTSGTGTDSSAKATEKGGCGSSLHGKAPFRANWSVFGTFVWVPAALGLLRLRRRA